jgi:hypothetical protein
MLFELDVSTAGLSVCRRQRHEQRVLRDHGDGELIALSSEYSNRLPPGRRLPRNALVLVVGLVACSGDRVDGLSTSAVDAIDRIEDVRSLVSGRPNNPCFDNRAQLATGPLAPVDMSQGGERLVGKPVWTGTVEAGLGLTPHSS